MVRRCTTDTHVRVCAVPEIDEPEVYRRYMETFHQVSTCSKIFWFSCFDIRFIRTALSLPALGASRVQPIPPLSSLSRVPQPPDVATAMSKRRFKESAVVLVAVAALVVLHRRRKAAHSAEDRNGCCVEDGKSTTSTSNFKKCDMSECQPDLNSINCSGGTSTRHDPCVNGHDGENSIPSTPKGDEESRRGVPQPGQQVFALYDSFSDAEPSQPPMDLSADVILLLRSFDVDPVRGKI